MKKTWVVIIIIIIILCCLYLLTTLILNQKINETVISLKNSGCPTTFAELKPKSTVEGKKAAELLTDVNEVMNIEPKAERNIAAQESDIADSINYEENPALFKKIVADNIETINLLLEASKYPCVDFDFKYEDGLAAQIPEPVGHLHNFCRLLRIYAKNLHGTGKTEQALNVLNQNVNLSFSLSDNIILFHLIKALALTKTLDLIQTISPKGSIATLESLVTKIDKIDVRTSLTKSIEAEMIMWQHAFSSRRGLMDNVIGCGIRVTSKQRFMLLLTNFTPIKKYAQLRLLKLMKREIELSKLAYFEAAKGCNDLEEYIKQSVTFSSLERLFIPNLKLFVIRSENLEAKRNITSLGLKTLIYKKKTGKTPQTLDEVISKVPVDSYSGKKYFYQKLPDGFLIYSTGADGKDDMGDSQKDITWRIRI